MKIGTLSMEVYDRKGRSSKKGSARVSLVHSLSGESRIACITEAIAAFNPDLFVCAGWSLESNADLKRLRARPIMKRWKGCAIVEVQHDKSLQKKEFSPPHRMYRVGPGDIITPLGGQFIAASADTKGYEGEANIEGLLEFSRPEEFQPLAESW